MGTVQRHTGALQEGAGDGTATQAPSARPPGDVTPLTATWSPESCSAPSGFQGPRPQSPGDGGSHHGA